MVLCFIIQCDYSFFLYVWILDEERHAWQKDGYCPDFSQTVISSCCTLWGTGNLNTGVISSLVPLACTGLIELGCEPLQLVQDHLSVVQSNFSAVCLKLSGKKKSLWASVMSVFHHY